MNGGVPGAGEVKGLSDVYLYTVDDLSALVQTAGEKRAAAVEQAEAIIDAGVQSFAHWLDQRASVPLIQALNRQAEVWREAELARALGRRVAQIAVRLTTALRRRSRIARRRRCGTGAIQEQLYTGYLFEGIRKTGYLVLG